jgi:hypothetical protein
MKAIAIVAAGILVSGFKIPDAEKNIAFGHGPQARMAAEAFGFKDVKIVGPAFFGCGREDAYRIEFTAVSVAGHKVSGLICGGLMFKGWTVRLDKIEPANP